MIELGTTVKDVITGFEGVVVGRTEWLNGCVRYGVQSRELKDGVPKEAQWLDEEQLSVVKNRKRLPIGDPTGGPKPTPRRTKDPTR